MEVKALIPGSFYIIKQIPAKHKKIMHILPEAQVVIFSPEEDITVGMQQRVEILKMLYRDNEILIFDEPTAVLTPQEIDELSTVNTSMSLKCWWTIPMPKAVASLGS